MTTPLPTALDYAAKGWRIVPIRPGEKRPALNGWQNIATSDPELITEWFTGPYHDHGIGIATGPETGIFVLDVDITDTKAGDETLADLEEHYGRLPETLMSITGSGGWHLLFNYPAGQEIRNDAGRRLGPGLDIRGIGGQIVAPPTIHPNGNAYQWDEGCQTIADAPQWLLELLTTPEPTQPPTSPTKPSDTDSVAARYNQQPNWPQLLNADGWTLAATLPTGETQWTRPGKDPREGISATVGHEGRDILTVFTSSIPWLPEDSYSRFGYYACRQHTGNRSEAATQLVSQETQTLDNYFTNQLITPEPATEPPENRIELAHLVDWNKLWTDDRPDQEWLAEPIVPKGRAIALYAPAKAGKSTIVLAIVAAVATGGRILGQTRATPTNVLYLDYEMTEDDLIERLTELGYGPQDNLEKLHYALLPSLPPLDTIGGATALLHLCDQTKAELVVVDTFGRAVEGDEDKADTVRAFYRHTGLSLKARGIAVIRTDHSGKSVEKGMRGSSAKADDVDVVWQLSRTNTNKGDGIRLNRTHSRLSWVPQDIRISRIETDHGYDYVIDAQDQTWADGTRQDADLLDTLNIPIEMSSRNASAIIRSTEHKMSDKRIRTAVEFRKLASRSQETMRLRAGITTATTDNRRGGRGENQSAAPTPPRQPAAPPQTPAPSAAVANPQVTAPQNPAAPDHQSAATNPSQTGRERPHKGTHVPETPEATQTTPLF